MQLLAPIIKREVQSFEVKQEAADAHNAWLNQRFGETVMHECASAYNLGGGRSAIIFPGSIYLVWLWTRWPRWDHYHVSGDSRMQMCSRLKTLFILISIAAVLAVGFLVQKVFRNSLSMG